MASNSQATLFYNAKPQIFEKAKALRLNMTPSELLLWEELRSKRMLGLKFRSQHPIDIFIVDFYCHSLKLVIEVDGGIHNTKEQKDYDIGREEELVQWGIKVIRFTNDEVRNNMAEILIQIRNECNKLPQTSKGA